MAEVKKENVRFHLCDNRRKKCGFKVPLDESVMRKFQVARCIECGRITKRNILSGKTVRTQWREEWQGDTRKALEIKTKALRVDVDDEGFVVRAWRDSDLIR